MDDEPKKLRPHQWAEILCAPCWSSMKRSAETLEEWAPCDVCRPKVEEILRSTEPKYEWLQRLPFPVAAKGDDERALLAMGVKTESFAGIDNFVVARVARLGPEHPGPWHWVDDERAPLEDPVDDEQPLILVDANGDTIIGVDDMSEPFPFVNIPSPRVRALTAAAPLLHELLLKAQWSGADPEDANRHVCPACGGVSRDHGGEGHTAACRIGTVLAQVEEASRG